MSINTPSNSSREGSDRKQPQARTLVALALAGALGVSSNTADATPTSSQSSSTSNRDGCIPPRETVVTGVNPVPTPVDEAREARIRTCHDIARSQTVRRIIAQGTAAAREEARTSENQEEIKFRVETAIRDTLEAMDTAYHMHRSTISLSGSETEDAARYARVADALANGYRPTPEDARALRDIEQLRVHLQRHLARDLNNGVAGQAIAQRSLAVLAAYLYARILHVPTNTFPRPSQTQSPFGGMQNGNEPNPFAY